MTTSGQWQQVSKIDAPSTLLRKLDLALPTHSQMAHIYRRRYIQLWRSWTRPY